MALPEQAERPVLPGTRRSINVSNADATSRSSSTSSAAAQYIADAFARLRRVLFVGQPVTETLADVCAGEAFVQYLPGQEVGLHELAERAADLVLAVRDDGRVRNRYPERVAEERGHREPVGQGTDHRRFRERADDSPPIRGGLRANERRGTPGSRRPATLWQRTSSSATPRGVRDPPASVPLRRRYRAGLNLKRPPWSVTRARSEGYVAKRVCPVRQQRAADLRIPATVVW